MQIKNLKAEAYAFIEHAVPNLGYTTVNFVRIEILEEDEITLLLNCRDDFQERLSWDIIEQHGYVTFFHPFTTKGKLNREQRELHVLAKQTCNSAAMAEAMTSAAGKRFVEEILEVRNRFKALVDWSNR